jgi:Bacteriocin-protection, YdeI or OmpD-Associated/Domain of unknown function (DUF1905)
MPTFTAVLELAGKTATGIPVPDSVVESLGAGKRVPIVVTIGDYSYRSSVAPYNGKYLISLSAENRAGAGVSAGDEITVTIEVDTAPRVVEVPADLAAALASVPAARVAFDALSFSNQRAHVDAVTGAKTPETRQRRIDGAIAKLAPSD